MPKYMMLQAITTKWLSPTNRRQARIKATAAAGSVTVSYDHGKSLDANHFEAAWTLARKFEWAGEWRGGGLWDGRHVFVCSPQGEKPTFITFGPDQK